MVSNWSCISAIVEMSVEEKRRLCRVAEMRLPPPPRPAKLFLAVTRVLWTRSHALMHNC